MIKFSILYCRYIGEILPMWYISVKFCHRQHHHISWYISACRCIGWTVLETAFTSYFLQKISWV